jgi:glutamate racemase
MKDGLIGIFDSGVGGLSILYEVTRVLPQAKTIYLADQIHVPYGSRTIEEVRRFAEGITRFLIDQGANPIVIASNTTSAAALYHVRTLFPDVSFVGMEPALKPAIQKTHTGVVGVIATQVTFQGELFAHLMEKYASTIRVLPQACPGLVEAVEAGALDTPETMELLRTYLSPMLAAGMDQLVLGCTHYPFLVPAIERVIGKGVAVIDPAPSVAQQTVRMLKQQQLGTNAQEACQVFYTSGDPAKFTRMIQHLLPTLPEKTLDVRTVAWQENELKTQAAPLPDKHH